ncbi:hypothetical protein BDR04DRAFT_1110659 [Suillus decipiens]|nr:hypothetical protein BDR04DRAFT_1110659 [Suillus decipiens]
MLSFGLSRTFIGLLVSRIICRAFNGKNGVIKNLLMDITDATNLPEAYGYLPISFLLVAIIGPVAGGSLSQPIDRFPEIFGCSELLKTYPYLLACVVPVVCASLTWLATYFYLKESISIRAPLLDLIKEWFLPLSYAKPSVISIPSSVLTDYEEANSEEISLTLLLLCDVLTSKVLTVAASNGTLILFGIAVNSILSIFYATSIELGGLSLDPPRIGAIFAISAFIGWVVWLAIFIQHMLIAVLDMFESDKKPLASMALFIRASAPNRALIGATNRVIQLVGGELRIICPACAGAVFSYLIHDGGDAWLSYYFFMTMGLLAIGTSLFLPQDPHLWEELEVI